MLLTRLTRPRKIDDVIGHQHIKKSLRAYLRTGDVPHMMFIGPPGIGKNCLAYAFATEFFGRDVSIGTNDGDPDYMELNASMDRGIDIVRDVIVPFMNRQPEKAPQQIIFLDEFDSMCLTGDTEIIKGSGTGKKKVRIDELPKNKKFVVLSVNPQTLEVERDKGKLLDSGHTEFFKITLSDNSFVKASKEHPFFQFDEDGNITKITTEKLSVGDYILNFREFDCPEKVFVESIKSIGVQKAWNIMVDNNHNFILGNGLLSHNTYPAQLALKEPMEKNEDKCIVIASLNNENGVKVDALHSRCAKFYFKAPTKNELIEYLLTVSSEIGLSYESNEIPEKIVEYYGADIRHMLMDCLEALKGFKDADEEYTVKMSDLPKIQMEENSTLAERVYNSETPKKEFFKVWRKEAIDCRRFLEEYFKLVQSKSKVFAVVDRNIRNGGSEMIQMSYLFDSLMVK